ncbi:MAG: GAF domain-containing protein [Anaerolineae bacterium]|nr:GAF domain-containing protein [Anaerolineae bacterium]
MVVETDRDASLTRQQLRAIHKAALAITSELSLSRVLETITVTARELVNARYAALGVPGPHGRLEQFITDGITEEERRAMAHPPEGKGLLGYILQTQETIRLDNLHESPYSVGFIENHPWMVNFLGVPIVARGEVLGSLYLCDKQDGTLFTAGDEVLIETLASYAAVAIENARLYQQVRRLAVLEERERIGMDLHDGIIQSIYAVGLTLEHSALLLEDDPEAASHRLRYAIDALNQTIRDIRNYIMDLRPQRMKVHDLGESLRQLVHEFRANTLVEIKLKVEPGIEEVLDEGTSTALFHIAQEALANAAKHAAASELKVIVERLERDVRLQVCDDGVGFDPDQIDRLLGHGLANMTLRAQAVGGQLEVESRPMQGTTVRALFPFKREQILS